MELFMFARFHAKPNRESEVAASIRDEVLQVRAEPGCLSIGAYRSTRDPRLFYIHSRWVDEAALTLHASLPHTVRFLEQVRSLIDHDLDVTRTVSLE